MRYQKRSQKVASKVASKNSPIRENSKGSVAYWQARIFQNDQRGDGKWYARFQHRGRRSTFSLQSTEKRIAAVRARDYYAFLKANGWEAFQAKYRPEIERRAKLPTIGQFVDQAMAVTATFANPPRDSTLKAYRVGLTKIACDCLGANGLEKPLDKLTRQKIEQWRVNYVSNGMDRRKASVSAASLIRNAKTLFQPRVLSRLNEGCFKGLEIESPFAGIEAAKSTPPKFQASFDLGGVIAQAFQELSSEPLKCVVLAGALGLRKGEIDALEWDMVNFSSQTLQLRETEWFTPKTEDSRQPVLIEMGLLKILMDWQETALQRFVVESTNMPRPQGASARYRCQSAFKIAVDWLREKGVTGQKPLHALRKAFGSLVCERGGLFAASRALRHSSTAVTEAHYVDSKAQVTAGLGSLVEAAQNHRRSGQ